MKQLAVLLALAAPATATAASTTGPASAAGESSILSGPPQFTNDDHATFTFASTQQDDAYQCKLDGAASFTACSNPYTTPSLGEGPHTLQVRAIDNGGTAGGVEATPSTYSWTVDLTPPNTTFTYKPAAKSNEKNAQFLFESNDPTATFVCSLNGGNPAPCTSPKQYNDLSEGERTFSVRAIDKAGNQDPTPETLTWTLDTTAPETEITAGPTGLTSSAKATFEFAAPGSIAYECRVDGAPWDPCASPFTPAGIADGNHKLEVRAADEAGNLEATPAVRTWSVDTAAPAAVDLFVGPAPAQRRAPVGGKTIKPIKAKAAQNVAVSTQLKLGTARFQTTPLLEVKWGASGAASYVVEYAQTDTAVENLADSWGPTWKTLAPEGTTATSKLFTASQGKRTCFRARAKDAAGNVAPNYSYTCTFVPLKASKLFRSGAWTKKNDAKAYLGQTVVGSGTGQLVGPTFTINPGTSKHVAIVATTCPTCGKVKLSSEGTEKIIDLTSPTTQYGRIFTMKVKSPWKAKDCSNDGIGGLSCLSDAGKDIGAELHIKRWSGTPRIEGAGWSY